MPPAESAQKADALHLTSQSQQQEGSETLKETMHYLGPTTWISRYQSLLDPDEWHSTSTSIHSVEAVLSEFPTSSLTELRRILACRNLGFLDLPADFGGRDMPLLYQLLLQFTIGYHNLNFRDIADIGHARLLLEASDTSLREEWGHRIRQGELLALAVTEPTGGTNVMHTMQTTATVTEKYVILTGTKSWISRLQESSAFLVLHNDTHTGKIGLTLVPASTPGMELDIREPSGLNGTSWGWLRLSNATVPIGNLVTADKGAELFRAHFRKYRKVAAALVLGAGAAAMDDAMATIRQRIITGRYQRIRDTSAEALARNWARIDSTLAWLISHAGDPTESIPKLLKATAVEAAIEAARWSLSVTGASGFELSAPASLRLRDLEAFLFADGAQDALWRSAGRAITQDGLCERGLPLSTAQHASK
jgi:alkylation response protein AidB-like acyl-CoA dehydrogenase